MKKGFTLIELLVVVLIIGILAAIAVPQYQKAVTKAQITSLFPVLKAFGTAWERYILENGSSPASLQDLDIDIPSSFIFASGTGGYELRQDLVSSTDNTVRIVVVYRTDIKHITCEVRDVNVKGQSTCLSLGFVKETCSSAVYMGTGTWYCYGIR